METMKCGTCGDYLGLSCPSTIGNDIYNNIVTKNDFIVCLFVINKIRNWTDFKNSSSMESLDYWNNI